VTVCVKICGINDAAAFDAAVGARAEWLGFNFFPPSPRYVTPEQASGLAARAPGGPPQVGLFVDPTPRTIEAVLQHIRLDALQLYGLADMVALRTRFGLPIWRACGVSAASDLPLSADGADRLLIEAKPPPDATRPGGNALRFDWSLLHGWRAPAPWILAGGLTVDNVTEAIGTTGATAVDVSSGVERVRGVKDPTLIRSFIAAARSGIRFRSAVPADAEALGQAHVSAWREAYPGLVPDAVLAALDPLERAAMWRQALAQGTAVHLAERDGRIVGFISCGAQRDRSLPCQGEIHAIYVLQAAQRQGVGRALMGFAARDLLRRGHDSALLWVMEGNTAARQFYRELNGREIARREQAREGHSATGIAYAWDDVAALL
jgi:phosphoribosylanthranilate isomerase